MFAVEYLENAAIERLQLEGCDRALGETVNHPELDSGQSRPF